MKLHPIDPTKLNADPVSQSLWFRSEDGDLYIIFKEYELSYFEITLDGIHLEGGYERVLRTGKTQDKDHQDQNSQLPYKMARLIEYDEEINEEFRKKCIELVYNSDTLEKRMKEGLMDYLSSKGTNIDLLKVESPYESFREIIVKRANLLELIKKNFKTIQYLSVFAFFFTIGLYFYQFLSMDENKALVKACDQGESKACQKIAYSSLAKGKGVKADLYTKKAKQLTISEEDKIDRKKMTEDELKDSCLKGTGDKQSCVELMQRFGQDIWNFSPQDFQNHPQYFYYVWASDDENNYQESVNAFYDDMQTCSRPMAGSCESVANRYYENGLLSKAKEYFLKACELKLVRACLSAARITKDQTEMEMLYSKVCAENEITGCFFLKTLRAVNLKEKEEVKKTYLECRKGIEKECLRLKNNK